MSRVSFYIYKEQADGKMVLDRDVDTDQLRFFRDGNLVPFPQLVNNGDGTYYFTPSGSGNYTVQLNREYQDEFYNIYMPDSDNLDETRVDGTSIAIFNGDLALYNSASILYTGSLIDDLTSHADSASLAANQGREINFLLAGKLNANDTFLKESNIVQEFTTSLDNIVQSAESMKIDFSDTSFLGNQTTYVGGLRTLDTEVINVITGSTAYRNYLVWGLSGSFLIKDDTVRYWGRTTGGVSPTTTSGSYYVPRSGTITRATLRAYVPSTGSTDFGIILRTQIDGVQTTIENFNYDAGEVGYVTSGSIGGWKGTTISFDANDRIDVVIDMEEDDNDPILMGDVSVVFEVTYE